MLTAADVAGLPLEEFAFPGPLRDQLVAAIVDGSKTSTTSLVEGYEPDEPLPVVGGRGVVIDSDGQPVCVIENTAVRIAPLGEVDEQHARDEGEGYETVAAWRAGHEEFWHGPEVRAEMGADHRVTDATLAVFVRFRVVAR
ncbi:RNA-binding protein [Frondihabitans sp. PAMC 28766]|uniref:ASCH domain-containing protein n=1 Tax=Frondihabitans sp. PAMC 28766 TaxID=1795630 RepID=UPI00078E3C76|nr:ASCH domain-containing protein [Frondihabitans sp. PAMC 28766]AMM18843.1 RNA-binding protein [Frondihabitans sp. PAMC 28766]